MELINCKNAYYVKLGRGGVFEESSIKASIIRIGWIEQSLSDINGGKWEKIQKQIEKEVADKGAATRDCRALRMLCESTSDDIWITFHGSHLWWCKVTDIELEEPITGEMYQVQVKSTASLRDFQEFTETFGGGKYRRLFFVVHTPDKKLEDTLQPEDSPVQIILPKQLAEMVVELGLLNWLMNKIR